ncbi:MAG TPA: flavohemoglobin expression-modulating QEGLA motif protein [Candidatus Kapabacteria bacterium]|nr:flavohemoglobin expression-modulating QEGLA motif protein [Candidatus Kapabacteria bacterium]
MQSRQAYLDTLKTLSDRLIAIQQPIRILDSIKWPAQWRQDFFKSGMKTLPPADSTYYQSIPLNFNFDAKQAELQDLRKDIVRKLGRKDGLGRILLATTEQYLKVIDLLRARGTPAFGGFSKDLYGSAHDHLSGDKRTLREVGEQLCSIFSHPAAQHIAFSQPKKYDAEAAVRILRHRLASYFPDGELQVKLSDGIVSDAAAGGDSIKMNARSMFSERDLQVLEVHEGWVHVGTTLNGRRQPYASWLSVGSPRIAAIQEGLALLMETLTFSSFPHRARRVSDRVAAIHLAEEGADFIQVFRHLADRGVSEPDAFTLTQRVFRGGLCDGGAAFTKDLAYVKGFVENVNFMRSAIAAGLPELIPMLFVGKITLDDIPVLYERYLEGMIEPPKYLPAMFRDLNGLYVWFGFSNGMGMVDIKRVQKHFLKNFAQIRPVCPIEMAPRAPVSTEPE